MEKKRKVKGVCFVNAAFTKGAVALAPCGHGWRWASPCPNESGWPSGGFWCILAGFGDHFGWLFGVVAGSLQTPWQTPWPANLHQKTFAAPHQFGTVRNVAAAT